MTGILHKKDIIAFIYITILTIVALVYGFYIIPSPAKEQKITADHKRVIDLGSIQTTIDDYYTNNGVLPTSLNALNYNASDATTPLNKVDPQTKQPYEYNITSQTSYQLCATFSTSSSEDDPNGYDDANADYSSFSSQFNHPAGHKCFTETESPDVTGNNTSSGQANATMTLFKDATCQWTPTFYLTGFSPDSTITVNSNGMLSDNCDSSKTHSYNWTGFWNAQTDANGAVTIDYLQNDYGNYTYTFTDEDGNTASIHFSYGQNAAEPTIYPSQTPLPTRFPCKAGEMCPMIPANQPSPGIYNGNLSTTPTPGHGGGGGGSDG